MRFVDEVTISVKAGDGGDGCVAWRREAHVPRGGPAGGDGGRGGDVVFVVDPGLTTLLDLRYQKHYRAERGQHGQGHDRFGRAGGSRVVRVPPGTMVFDAESGERIGDLTEPDQRLVVAHGGRGGHGNLHFVSPTNRAPQQAEPGEPGEERRLRVELKLLAEVGLVGLPNAGKSTLISRVSAARPKIADYPFTTLVPSLGVVGLSGDRAFVMADIPGLIEGAHRGVGLGDRFLRHLARTRVLVFLLDDRHRLAGEPGDPAADLAVLRAELAAHDPALLRRPAVIALNKVDLIPAEQRESAAADLATALAAADPAGPAEPVHTISAVSGHGVDTLLEAVWRALRTGREQGPHDP